jgi:nuclear pore complex protein Nup155
MGGYDGSLYEFFYESLVSNGALQAKTPEQLINAFYDGPATGIRLSDSQPSITAQLLLHGKRGVANLFTGSERPHKCRKLNHTASGFSAIASTILPDWLVKAPAVLFGADKTGPLEKILHDDERQILYTLSAQGHISVYDLRSSELSPKAAIDCDKVARQYLSAVAKGHMFAPSSFIEFVGGGSTAQAGVGGMDGARSILKLADTDSKSKILAPISIHVLTRSESSRLTLLAVTATGLRFYLTCLSTSMDRSELKLSSKIVLCHIRAPPPVDPTTGHIKESLEEGDIPEGMIPGLLPQTSVDASAYSDGRLFLALQRPPLATPNGKEIGNIIFATNADFIARKVIKKDGMTIRELPGGLTETISLAANILPGGRVIDASVIGFPKRVPLMNLMINSQTPSDNELSVGLVPPFFPKISVSAGLKDNRSLPESSSGLVKSNEIAKSSDSKASGTAIALQVVSNFLLSRPLSYGVTISSSLAVTGDCAQPQLYRISSKFGSSGFSRTAEGTVSSSVSGARSSNSSHNKSARLSPWLLRPSAVPLNSLSLNHLLPQTSSIALSVGGLHFFRSKTVLAMLADTLITAGPDLQRDTGILCFLTNYGAKNFCSMCLALGIGCGPAQGNSNVAEELKKRAISALFGHGGTPRLDKKPMVDDGRDAFVVQDVSSSDSLVPKGYEFTPSSLSEGIICLASRLLRPIWFKPAVVVTEGQRIKAISSASKQLPAKVELLLENETLQEVRSPLFSLKQIMQSRFRRAIETVPGVRKTDSNQMEIDETSIITGGMRFQGTLKLHGTTKDVLSNQEAVATARLIEERNIHSLYRLVSRTVQLLDLLSLLKRAHEMDDLPEVEWGLLHGITMSQLVQNGEGQERIENLLNSLVSHTNSSWSGVTPSADSDRLARTLVKECYLFFSPGSRFAYLGFRAAREALGCMESSARRVNLSKEAVEHFMIAARFWTSAPIVTGRLMHSGEIETYEQKVEVALRHDSPLAKAASVLLDLGEYVAIVDICASTASNFSGKGIPEAFVTDEDTGYDWEKTLYHSRKQHPQPSVGGASTSSTSSSKSIVLGTSVTPQDAISTCHAVVLYYLLIVLNGSSAERSKRMMISACAASTDTVFLKALFEYLRRTKHEEMLLKIDSTDLERWLSESKEPQLMWQYYMVQRKFTQAGELMWEMATSGTSSTPLDDRILYLERCISAYTSAIESASNRLAENGAEVTDLEKKRVAASEYLDVARIQAAILKEATSLSLTSQLGLESLEKLKMSLVEISDLFNEYALLLSLHDICLRILLVCRHSDDAGLIERLWKSVLCQEIVPCATRSEFACNFLANMVTGSLTEGDVQLLSDGDEEGLLPLFESCDWLEPLQTKVATLGRSLYGHGADYVCPIDFLAISLEGKFVFCFLVTFLVSQALNFFPAKGLRLALQSCSGSSAPSRPWPLEILINIGVSFPALMDAYNDILQMEERSVMGGADPLRRFLCLKSIVELLEEWTDIAFRGSVQNRAYRELATTMVDNRILSQIGGFKVSLEELTSTGGDEVERWLERLVRLEELISRL